MSFKVAILLGLVCFAAVVLAEVTEEDDVAVLTDDNFEGWLANQKFALLELYAPWCGHCKKLTPEYAKAAKHLKTIETPVLLGKTDATANEKLSKQFAVQGFPTLKFYAEGNWVDYNGGRTEKEIIAWVTKRTGSITTDLKNAEGVAKLVESSDVAVVYFGNSESDKEYLAFKTVAMGIESLQFGHIFGDANAAEANNAKVPSVVLFKKFDEKRNDYTGDLTKSDELKKFVDTYSFATVMKFDDRAIEKVFQQGNPTIFIFSNSNEASVAAEKAFAEAATAKKGGKVLFSISKPDDGSGHFQKLADYVGVNTQNVPAIMLVHAADDMAKYKFESSITAENVVKFVEDFDAKKLTKYLKSEDIPAEQPDAVRVIVGKSFQSEVINNDKDVLVEFYAPWCGHCKQLAPKYEAAAKKLAANKNIVIAKVDSTANEVPGVNIKGFPTLKFWPGNKKSAAPIDFDGAREEEGIIKWIKEHTTHDWVEIEGGAAAATEEGTRKATGAGHDDL